MLKKILIPTIFLILAYGFWVSADFKEISAGVAIFLFGMISLEQGFKAFTGGVLEKILRASTDRLWKSLSFGILTTTLTQSSSLVSVITISFLSAGILGLSEGIGIIFGANLGTTTGAWLVAAFGMKVNLSTYAMPMLVFGIILLFQQSTSLKGLGYVLSGIGFLFLGIHHMKEGFDAFKASIDLSAYALPGLGGVLVYTLIGLVATVIMQSSHATLVLIITALAIQQITYENALALAIGANIGTTITALLGAMGANIQGKRLAGAHLIFNVGTGFVAIFLLQPLAFVTDQLSQIAGIAADNFTLKLALFHTLFNLLGILLLLPFMTRLVSFLQHILQEDSKPVYAPKYIVSATIDFPDTAVKAVRDETLHIYDNAREIILRGLGLKPSDLHHDNLEKSLERRQVIPRIDIDALYEQRVKKILNEVIVFISQAMHSWKGKRSSDISWLRDANRNIAEAVKATKHLQKNMQHYAVSNNHAIRHEYNHLRAQVAQLLRDLEHIRLADSHDGSLLALDELKLELKETENRQSKKLYQLIRENSITPEMGTSLMIDSGYVNEIQQHLLAMAASLFVQQTSALMDAERRVALDDSELKQVLDASHTEKPARADSTAPQDNSPLQAVTDENQAAD